MVCVGLCLLHKLVFAPFLHFSFSGCVHQCPCLGLMSNPSHVLHALLLHVGAHHHHHPHGCPNLGCDILAIFFLPMHMAIVILVPSCLDPNCVLLTFFSYWHSLPLPFSSSSSSSWSCSACSLLLVGAHHHGNWHKGFYF